MLAGALILIGAVAAAIGLMVLLRHIAGDKPLFRDDGAPGAMFGAVRGPVAVLLAFVIFLAFQGYTGAKSAARTEASSVLSMSRSAALLPEEDSGLLRKPLICYARAVVRVGWPAMERGGEDPTAEGWIEVAEGIIEYVPVRTPIQREALSQFFIEANELETARDDRLAAVDGFVPTPAWIVLILGGVMVIGYAATFADPRERTAMQGVTIGAIATVIVSGLLLIAFFDAPYADRPGSVKPTAMEAALDQLELKRLAAPAAGPLPCDFSGRPQAAA